MKKGVLVDESMVKNNSLASLLVLVVVIVFLLIGVMGFLYFEIFKINLNMTGKSASLGTFTEKNKLEEVKIYNVDLNTNEVTVVEENELIEIESDDIKKVSKKVALKKPVIQPREKVRKRFQTSAVEKQKITLKLSDEKGELPLHGEAGKPVLPVKPVSFLIPEGHEVTDIKIIRGKKQEIPGNYLIEHADPRPLCENLGFEVVSRNSEIYDSDNPYPKNPCEKPGIRRLKGYEILMLNLNPVEYLPKSGKLYFYPEMSVEIKTKPKSKELITGSSKEKVKIRKDKETVLEVESLIENPEEIGSYTGSSEKIFNAQSGNLPQSGLFEYVIITSSALESEFQKLLNHKKSKGLTATLVTTEYIYANYTGTENGDNADKVRDFIRDAYNNWNTKWVLLGGDVEVVPHRGVYDAVGSTTYNNLPTDMYFACLDGPWDNDGDGIWGESNDGFNGSDIDHVPEVYIGRAPASNIAEAINFVNKTIFYETVSHINKRTSLWLGEKMDASTWGSPSAVQTINNALPGNWFPDIIEHYDNPDPGTNRSGGGGWTGNDFVNDLNSNVNMIFHLGHANSGYNAKISTSSVGTLTNEYPYFMYSQGCISGGFDYDVCIGEKHVIHDKGGFAVVMNSREGWYIPGGVGASHYYAYEFFDAVFNEQILNLGEANHDSKMDNLFRVGSVGVYRWIHHETNLLGDPETLFQGLTIDGKIRGKVYYDKNGDGLVQPGEKGLENEVVYVDYNDNDIMENGSFQDSNNTQKIIPDLSVVSSEILVNEIGVVKDVNVNLDITHTYDNDLIIRLVSPSGASVLLCGQEGGYGDNFTNTTFDDEASIDITDGTAPFTGVFRPEGKLSRLDGSNVNGIWKLSVEDASAWDNGTLNHWSIEIEYGEPFRTTDVNGSYGFLGLYDGNYTVKHVLISGWNRTNPVNGKHEVIIINESTHENIDFLINNVTSVGIPESPSNLTVSGVASRRLELKWVDNSNNEQNFKIERSTNNQSFTEIRILGADIIGYNDTGLIPNTTYYYRVRASNSLGNSNYSNIASGVTLENNAPVVSLVSPENNSNFSEGIVNFNCSASDDNGLRNMSLYIWNLNGSLVSKETRLLSGTSGSAEFSYNFTVNMSYKWNCLAYDDDNQDDWFDSNYSLIIERTCGQEDVNCDKDVDIRDLTLIAQNVGLSGCNLDNNWCNRKDVTRDGTVGLKDLVRSAINVS
jgi:subtilisin-like proprotein convertase family protein